MMKVTVGIHVLGALYGCPTELLEKVDVVKGILNKTVKQAQFSPVGEQFYQFKPFGVTGVILLSESHFSIHTWPEKNMVAVDVFTCGKEGNAEHGFDIIAKLLKAKRVEKNVVRR